MYVGDQVTAIESSARGVTLALRSGARIAADLVVVAAGIRPRDELARAAGLACTYAAAWR